MSIVTLRCGTNVLDKEMSLSKCYETFYTLVFSQIYSLFEIIVTWLTPRHTLVNTAYNVGILGLYPGCLLFSLSFTSPWHMVCRINTNGTGLTLPAAVLRLELDHQATPPVGERGAGGEGMKAREREKPSALNHKWRLGPAV